MKRYMIFFAPEGGEGGGGEETPKGTAVFGPAVVNDDTALKGDEEVRAQTELEQEGGEKKTEGEQKQVKKEEGEGEQKSVVVDAEALAKSFGAIIAQNFPQKQEQQTPPKKKYEEMTQEEREKELGLWTPTKEWQAKFDNLETREAALIELRDGMASAGAKISKMQLQELRDELGGTLEETRKFMRDMQNQAAEERLAKAYPDLAKAELAPIVKGVSDELVASGKKYTREADLFKDLASGVEAVMHAAGLKDFKLSTGSNPANKTKAKTNPNALPVVTPGAGGQAGGKTQQAEKPRAIAIFEK